jgi:chromosomal replication initiator protein
VKPQDAWNAAYHQLELQLDRASFDTWLRSAVLLSVEDGVYVIGVHNSYARDMLQHRLYRNVARILRDVTGQDVTIRFEVHKAGKPTTTADEPEAHDAPLLRFLAQKSRTPQLPETSETRPQQSSLYDLVQSPQRAGLPESELNPRFTFERFMVNQSNRIVYEAALSVAEHTASLYNPFLIYGGVGLGKTHLVQAIAHTCQQKGLRTVYIPSEVFTNDLIAAIRERTTAMFRDKYRTADVLLVDDIQFISGKETTQEEFFHTFNALVNFNKQIVLVSDRHPSEMRTLEDRLRSRFEGGLVADIQAPEFETRIAILKMWADERGVRLPYNVLEMVAQRVPKNVRELEGAFNQIVAQTKLGQRDTSLPSVESTLNRYHNPRERVSLEEIINVTAQNFGFIAADLRGKKRTARINTARQVAMYLCRELTEASLPQIGDFFGGRSHTTIMHGIDKIVSELEYDKVMESRILKIRKAILSVKH